RSALRRVHSVGGEAQRAVGLLRALHARQLLAGHHAPAALLVHQLQHAASAGGDRLGHGLLDLVRRLCALQDEFPGGVLHPDLDLHRRHSLRKGSADDDTPSGSACIGKLAMPRQVSAASSASASAFGTLRPAVSQNRAAAWAAPTRPAASNSARSRLTPVSAMMVSAIAVTDSRSARSTRSRAAGSLRRSDSKTSRKASLSWSIRSK